MSEDKFVKINVDTHQRLTELSQQSKIPMNAIVGLLVDYCVKYRMLDGDWLEALTSQQSKEMIEALEDDKKARNALNMMQQRAIIQAKMITFKAYLEALTIEERKAFSEEALQLKGDGNFLENLTSYQLFKVNGQRKFLKSGDQGKPKIPLIADADIIICDNGYHVKAAFCECTLWRNCKMRFDEYVAYRVSQDPQYRDVYRK